MLALLTIYEKEFFLQICSACFHYNMRKGTTKMLTYNKDSFTQTSLNFQSSVRSMLSANCHKERPSMPTVLLSSKFAAEIYNENKIILDEGEIMDLAFE